MAALQIVVFYLNNDLYGVDSSIVKKIIKYQAVTQIPEMPDYIEGVINLRGSVIPIINLNKRFGYGVKEVTKTTKIIIADLDSNAVGFVVDNITELSTFEENDIEILPDVIKKAGNTYLKRVCKREDEIVSILELDKILSEDELNKFKQ